MSYNSLTYYTRIPASLIGLHFNRSECYRNAKFCRILCYRLLTGCGKCSFAPDLEEKREQEPEGSLEVPPDW
jgi:hypothetical protein